MKTLAQNIYWCSIALCKSVVKQCCSFLQNHFMMSVIFEFSSKHLVVLCCFKPLGQFLLIMKR